jgi:hypothetical protein
MQMVEALASCPILNQMTHMACRFPRIVLVRKEKGTEQERIVQEHTSYLKRRIDDAENAAY